VSPSRPFQPLSVASVIKSKIKNQTNAGPSISTARYELEKLNNKFKKKLDRPVRQGVMIGLEVRLSILLN
jgi:hypothetical protein